MDWTAQTAQSRVLCFKVPSSLSCTIKWLNLFCFLIPYFIVWLKKSTSKQNLFLYSKLSKKAKIKYISHFMKEIAYWIVFNLALVSKDVKSLGGHFACLCTGFDFYVVKKSIIIFQKEKGNTFTFSIIFMVKSLQKEKNSKKSTTMTPNMPE